MQLVHLRLRQGPSKVNFCKLLEHDFIQRPDVLSAIQSTEGYPMSGKSTELRKTTAEFITGMVTRYLWHERYGHCAIMVLLIKN